MTTNMTVRVDTQLKKEAEELFRDFGLNMNTAYVMFLKQAVREQRIPFSVSRNIPNAETLAAIAETEDMIRNPHLYKSFNSIEKLLEDLDSDDEDEI